MLVINPEPCIDCAVCVPECPVDAIKPDTEEGMEKWVALNQRLADEWPLVLVRGKPLPDADEWAHKSGKLALLVEAPAD